MTDPYVTLGLDSGASIEEVKKAYRRLAKEFHPDRNQGKSDTVARFTRITEAYDAIVEGKPFSTPSQPSTPRDLSTVHLNYITRMVNVYFGGTVSLGNLNFRFGPGFEEGVPILFCHDNVDYLVFPVFVDPEGFSHQGADLYTEMTIKQRDIDRRKRHVVPNHPYPLGEKVTFDTAIKDQKVARFKGAGLLKKDGDSGDLYITVTIIPKSKYGFVFWVLIASLVIFIVSEIFK